MPKLSQVSVVGYKARPACRSGYSDMLPKFRFINTLLAGGAVRIFRIYIGSENGRRRQIFMVGHIIFINTCNYCPITDVEEGFASLHM